MPGTEPSLETLYSGEYEIALRSVRAYEHKKNIIDAMNVWKLYDYKGWISPKYLPNSKS